MGCFAGVYCVCSGEVLHAETLASANRERPSERMPYAKTFCIHHLPRASRNCMFHSEGMKRYTQLSSYDPKLHSFPPAPLESDPLGRGIFSKKCSTAALGCVKPGRPQPRAAGLQEQADRIISSRNEATPLPATWPGDSVSPASLSGMARPPRGPSCTQSGRRGRNPRSAR